ncbi:dipeptidase PepE [Campylobacter sp. RM3125]|uniref:dipeptidase PepE n=1 Tax=Campylobacter molothri TaxID=1032242 RepID=UPI00301D75DB|nr:dipeptidase PepE [Campylobacter sp. RM3125]MBZ7971057.1 dipeptidase PepE [Campylobacter sp. RM3124]
MLNILLLSSSSYKETGYLTHAKNLIENFLEECDVKQDPILFIPYAGVRRNNEEYEKKVKESLNKENIISIHHSNNPQEAISKAKVILVGGGNTFMLLYKLYKYDLLNCLAQRIKEGACYIGWSAGSNIAGKSIKTTNDMPIIMPKSFDALNLFPHQINPHFISGKIQGHNGESREERLEEFLIANPKETIYAIPEGSALRIKDDKIKILGHNSVLKFEYPMKSTTLNLNQEYLY